MGAEYSDKWCEELRELSLARTRLLLSPTNVKRVLFQSIDLFIREAIGFNWWYLINRSIVDSKICSKSSCDHRKPGLKSGSSTASQQSLECHSSVEVSILVDSE